MVTGKHRNIRNLHITFNLPASHTHVKNRRTPLHDWKYIWDGPISPAVKYGRAKIGHLCFELLRPVGTIDNATTPYQVLSQLFHLMNLLAQLLDKHACGRCAHLGLHLSHATPFLWAMESFQHALFNMLEMPIPSRVAIEVPCPICYVQQIDCCTTTPQLSVRSCNQWVSDGSHNEEEYDNNLQEQLPSRRGEKKRDTVKHQGSGKGVVEVRSQSQRSFQLNKKSAREH